MKYLTPEESLKYVATLEDHGFDLTHWEHLEYTALSSKPLGDSSFDLMDFRDTLTKINKEFGI